MEFNSRGHRPRITEEGKLTLKGSHNHEFVLDPYRVGRLCQDRAPVALPPAIELVRYADRKIPDLRFRKEAALRLA